MSRCRLIIEIGVIITLLGVTLVGMACLIASFCRDMAMRGTRITAEELNRERITVSIPFALRDFKDPS